MWPLLTSWALAFLLGLRHATEPDHVAAVATLVPEQRNMQRAMQLGAAWGLGHCLSIVACGGTLLLLRLNMSERVSDWLELSVSLLLLVLGTRSILRAMRKPADIDASHGHTHSNHARRKGLFIGLLHGVAGSGSLAALAFANMPSVRDGFAYLLWFGAGSILGMSALAGLAGTPLRAITQRDKAHSLLFAFAGALSIGIGLHYGLPIARRLFGT